MIAKLTAIVVFTGILSAGPLASPQTAGELLQKGIYTQDTVGNLDSAIKIYQELLNSKSIPRSYAAEAQYRLADCLLRKGDFASAAREFRKVGQDYSEYGDLVRAANGRALSAEAAARAVFGDGIQGPFSVAELGPLGTFQNGHYRHRWTGVEFDVPKGWRYIDTQQGSDQGELATLVDSHSHADVGIWIRGDRTLDVMQRLRESIAEKVRQRIDFEQYAIRPDSISWRLIGGNQALTAVADYVQGGRHMNESLTWIITEKTRALFRAHIAASDLSDFQPRFEQIIQSAVVP